MAKEQSSNIPFDLFSDTESEVEDFEGFDARDTRQLAEIALEVPLYHSTPLPKAKRVCVAVDDSSCSYNIEDDSRKISLMESHLQIKWRVKLLQLSFVRILVNWSSKLPTSVRK